MRLDNLSTSLPALINHGGRHISNACVLRNKWYNGEDKRLMMGRRPTSHFFALSSSSSLALFLLLVGIDFISSHNPWDRFHNLSGCHLGDRRTDLHELKCYLHRFGYLPTTTNYSDEFDTSLRSALLAYQHRFHLNATGTLDSSTVDLMVRPRCGVADMVNGTNTTVHGRNLYSYFPTTPKWKKRSLTYAFSMTGVTIEESIVRTVFARAFTRWSEVTTLSFTEVSPSLPTDITIGFFTGDHGDGEAFDGRLGTLAHAFSPDNGRFHLDAEERWVAIAENAASPELFRWNDAVDLESVAVHEIGHLLGLGHSTVAGAIMYPLIETGTRKVKLAEDDVNGIQNLYGINPNYNGGAVDSPSTVSVTGRDDNGGAPVATARVGLVVGIMCAVALTTSLLRV